ncbi:MAG: hypothetical protein LUF92_01810, partial [Clostridiales bacterium]|nr:hypothetical protein [Clostridiales bacterium]
METYCYRIGSYYFGEKERNISLRIISGRSGQGKTRYIMDEVIRLSAENPEKKYYVVVPEQFSLEMQTKLVERHPDHGYFNIDVLSFYRLAYRVFDECNFQPKDILEDLGVSLILKKIMTEHEDEFPFFKKSVRQAGFIDELKSMLMEFICYDVSWEELQELDEHLRDHLGLRSKCAELGRIYEYFDREISDRFMVAEQILDVLCTMAASSGMLREGIFYFDGFTGFTPVQLHFLEELLKVAEQVNISVTMEEAPFGRMDGEELFFFSNKTVRSLAGICQEAGVEMEPPVHFFAEESPRFENAELSFLEKNMFRLNKKSYDGPVEHIHLTTCQNMDMEVDYVVHKIEQLVRTEGYRYRDVAVLTGNVEEYASAFRRKADILQIPLFVDSKQRVSYHSGVETLRALLHLAVMDYSYESVFRYLKYGMSDFTDEETEVMVNYLIWVGVRGYGMWKEHFVRRMSQISEEKAEMLEDMRRRFLGETEACVRVLKDRKYNVREKMTALYENMCRLHYDKKLNEL